MRMSKLKHKVDAALKKAAPTILTCVGAAGVIATAVLAVKATPKALKAVQEDSQKNHDGDPNAATKMEAIRSGWKFYVPAAIVGTASLACIFSANVLNKKQQASLASAYAFLNRSYSAYKRKLVDLYGKEAHEKVIESLAAEKVDKDHTIVAQHLCGAACLDFDGIDEEDHLFYDVFSGRYFTSTVSKVLQAEYHLNRNLALNGEVHLNHFYDLLGIGGIDEGDTLGWFINDELYWIDFDHSKTVLDDGLECWIIDTVFSPGTYEDYCES